MPRPSHPTRPSHARALRALAAIVLGVAATLSAGASARADGIGIAVSMVSSSGSAAPFTLDLEARGGTPPYTWSVVEGALPAGLALSTTGEVTGTPQPMTAPATFTVRVVDANQQVAESTITVGGGQSGSVFARGGSATAQGGSVTTGSAPDGWPPSRVPPTLNEDPAPAVDAICDTELTGAFGRWARPLCDGYRHPDATAFSRSVIGSMLERLMALPAWLWE
ncbi:MAG: Ig domain-containing protein [Dehalococcoidia bacterium]